MSRSGGLQAGKLAVLLLDTSHSGSKRTQGILLFDPSTSTISPLLTRRNLERFKGPNDLIVSSANDIYFTDQGQTGLTDQTGCVYRLSPSGKIDCLVSNGVSPNGLALSPDERFLYLSKSAIMAATVTPPPMLPHPPEKALAVPTTDLS